ncbi:hypothetical protein L2E82_08338 [Cichorium intybus]|uniref:Uncharacterized protein n=1 Tax=Cichorium intybus TaxID=13427 RepID=A0ACB9G6W5_CICIN|nr:hypothetical protein L2E82_08338 [Cichorium intybus]
MSDAGRVSGVRIRHSLSSPVSTASFSFVFTACTTTLLNSRHSFHPHFTAIGGFAFYALLELSSPTSPPEFPALGLPTMSSEIEVVDGVQESKDRDAANGNVNGTIEGGVDGESLRDDVYTADVYGYLEKLPRLVESEGCSVSQPDTAEYIIEVFPSHSLSAYLLHIDV